MSRRLLALIAIVVAGVTTAACGSSDEGSDDADLTAPSAASFPKPGDRTIEEFYASMPPADDVVVSPAGQTYAKGPSRFSFGVFELDASAIPDADVAIYAGAGPEGHARGPYPAKTISITTDPAFASKTTAAESQPVTVAYISELEFDRDGEWRLVAVVRDGGELRASRLPSIVVGRASRAPDVGERAPRVHTPTVEDVGGISEIETRIPPDTMHSDDLYDVLGKQPVVLLFATPALCMSRVCGPVVDIAEQVHSETEGVTFIHQEVYVDNDPNRGIRPQLKAYGLQTEPWLFVIDRSGRISTRIEGPFSVEELRAAVEKAGGELD
jgi:hypothetical protein